jgi:hypothetical protein
MKSRRWFAWLFALVLAMGAASSFAQAEPTVEQIYQAAGSGQVRQAQDMIDQVLRNHPNSAKAHYVKAELAARELDAATAQRELAKAEQLAPGLPFARPEAVQALRTQVERIARAPAAPKASTGNTRPSVHAGAGASQQARQEAPAQSFPWGALAIGAVVVFAVIAFLRSRAAARNSSMGYGGMPGGMPPQGPFGGPGGYPPGAYPPGAPQPGMGSTLGRGLATGLAIGAGAVAAQEIGRRMLDNGHQASPLSGPNPDGGFVDPSGLDGMANADMGGQDFGIRDPGGWDDGGGGFDDGGGWDS